MARKVTMLQLLLFAILSVAVQSTDIKERIGLVPPPMPGFVTGGYMGRWFMQFRKAPCSNAGSTFFTDFTQNVSPEGKKSLLSQITWRRGGLCNSNTERLLFRNQPGEFTLMDNMGDTISGLLIVVAIDYKKFVIHWGCTKMSATGEICDDPWISVGTRFRIPPPAVVNMIENILRSRWGISIGELTKVPHKTPCKPRTCARKKF